LWEDSGLGLTRAPILRLYPVLITFAKASLS